MLPFSEFRTSPIDLICKMKAGDNFSTSLINSNDSNLNEVTEKDDEVIITLEVPSRLSQTIVIPSDSDSDDSDITVLPVESCKAKQANRPSSSTASPDNNAPKPVVNLDSDDDIYVFDNGMKSIFDVATSVVVKGNDPFLSASIGVNEDDCKMRLLDLEFSYPSSTTKKSEDSVESGTVGITTEILDIHAPIAKPVFLTSGTLPENNSSASVDVLFADAFPKATHPTSYALPHLISHGITSNNETVDSKKITFCEESKSNRPTKKHSRHVPIDKKFVKESPSRRSSNTNSHADTWSVVSTVQNKVVLRRSPRPPRPSKSEDDSKKRSADSPQICKKKCKQGTLQSSCGSSGTTDAQDVKSRHTRHCNKTQDSVISNLLPPSFVCSVPQEEQSMCYGCKQNFGVSQLSYCMAGHGCCGQCIQIQVKTLLAKGRKGTLKCRYIACNSFYLVSQLRNSLPPMVVEILEEKLDREYCDNAAKLMMQATGISSHCSNNCSVKDSSTSKDTHVCRESLLSEDEDDHHKQNPDLYPNLPKNWEPMSKSEEYRLVEVCKGSEEYNWVAALFHQTMTRPRATIVKIKHLQNPILWQFYTVKKMQMERDSSRPVNEKNLFHGTSKKAVEAICRSNFDWRLCGSHGTTYGQGSYFARDAAYSHMYTDQPVPPNLQQHTRHIQAPIPNAVLFNPPQGSAPQLSQQPHHHIPSHPHQVGQPTSGQQLAHQIIFQTFPGTSHSVSIAALQSCRFARIPVGPPGGPHHQVIIPPGGVPPTAISFGSYWSLNSGPSASSQLPQLTRPNASVSHSSSSTSNKQLHPPVQHHHHHHPHHLSSAHLNHPHHAHHLAHQPVSHSMMQDHIHVMFLARVLVGEYTLGKNGYRKPPSKDPSDPYGKCYDTCVNDINNPTIYVIFNSSQCYPEYVIEYTNKPREI